MKKGLSVLLIVAALFGFYGGASSLTDVLACKDYWEKEGEKSTADMNKLEDGLNQLGENEQAYLDGLDQLAEAEPKLEEGKQTLAEKEAEFAAAPGKLAAARAKLAAGKAALAQGESDLDSLKTLIDGINQVLAGYPTYRNGYKALRDGTGTVFGMLKSEEMQENLASVDSLLKQHPQGAALRLKLKEAVASLNTLAGDFKYNNNDYSDFNDALLDVQDCLAAADTVIDTIRSGLPMDAVNSVPSLVNALKNGSDQEKTYAKSKAAEIKTQLTTPGEGGVTALYKLQMIIKQFDPVTGEQVAGKLEEAVNYLDNDNDALVIAGLEGFANIIGGVDSTIADKKATLADVAGQMNTWTEGYKQIQGGKSSLKTLAGGIAQIIGGVQASGNKELIAGMNKAAKATGFNPDKYASTKTSVLMKDLTSSTAWMEDYYNDANPVVDAFALVLPQLKAKEKSGEKQLKEGYKEYNNGKKLYAQGLADYEAAPAKLEAGRQQLADGLKQLEDGKKQLAQYEDGEQQVRDGLATLMSAEPNGGLESILDRRGGDDEFDDANGHLDIKEGLDAVDVGRGYQADSGELITKEITNRAVGTAAGLGAAVLACLAALLSLIKKYKGAAVTAVLAAIAGVAGAVVGNGAGSEFSNIAGSTVGSLPWIAAGVTAAVACVFAIVNFTAKAE